MRQAPSVSGAEYGKSRVVVTGGSGTIGSAAVEAFLRAGNEVVVVDKEQPPRRVVDAAAVSFIDLDVTDREEVEALRYRLDDDVGLTHLVSLAGGGDGEFKPLREIEVDRLVRSVELNLTAHILLVRSLLPLLERRPGTATIALVSSINALRDWALPAYSAAKAGLLGFLASQTTELGRSGIRINAVLPGTVPTERTRRQPKDFLALAMSTALGRLTTPEEVADTLVALTSLSAITGHALVVDCGQNMVTRPWQTS